MGSFESFRKQLGVSNSWPAPVAHVTAFIAQLSIDGKAPSTISTYISAISFMHKINGWCDPTTNFIIKKLKEGSRRLKGHNGDSRRPITVDILGRLCNLLQSICSSNYEAILFKAAFLLAFFGFLRVGEFTDVSKNANNRHNLGIGDILIDGDTMKVIIRSSKTDQKGAAVTLQFEKNANESTLCPITAMQSYIDIRPAKEGALFIHFGGSSLTQYQLNSILKKGITMMGMDPKDYSPHSFRIGAATAAAIGGIPVESIMSMGRWQSSAVLLYIRPQRIIQSSRWCKND